MRKFLSLVAIVLVSALMLSGCGFSSWQDDEVTKNIKEIKRVSDNDGKVYLEITYTDDSDPDRFLIPEGVSIVSAKADYSSVDRKTTVTIRYSDGSAPFVFEIPDGVDGSAVNKVEITEKNGMRYLSFKYVDADGNDLQSWDVNIDEFRGDDGATWLFGEGAPDGDPSNPLTAKAGDFYLDTENFVVYNKKADGTWQNMGTIKGTGISSIKPFYDDKSLTGGYEIVTTDILLDGDGNPILDDDNNLQYVSYKVYSSAVNQMEVSYNEETGMYEFVLTITDAMGNKISLGAGDDKICVQRPPMWHHGYDRPDSNSFSAVTFDGDFYYSLTYNEIYMKKNGIWELLVSLKSDEEINCEITFKPEGGVLSTDENAYPSANGIPMFNTDGSVTVKVKKGQCYPSSNSIPVPVREGYVFRGWYKTKDTSPINGAFTDMVPVYENVVLYALWDVA